MCYSIERHLYSVLSMSSLFSQHLMILSALNYPSHEGVPEGLKQSLNNWQQFKGNSGKKLDEKIYNNNSNNKNYNSEE